MIIGMCGWMGSGKDSAADVLVSEYGFLKTSMAAALRQECKWAQATFDVPAGAPPDIEHIILNRLAHVDIKPTSVPARRLLQWYGTEYRRAQDPDYWVKQIESVLNHAMDVVISDIRFPNEADMIHRHGGQLWLIRRDSVRPAQVLHSSEMLPEMDLKWDAILDNNGDQNELENKVRFLARSWYAEKNDPSVRLSGTP